MRKVLSLFVIAALLLTMGIASSSVGNPDTECQANGFDFGIEKYQCGYTMPEEGSAADNYEISVEWGGVVYDDLGMPIDCSSVDWTADPAVDGVLTKEGTSTFTHEGGLSGTIVQTGQNGVSHVTFCGNETPMVPEFGTMIAVLTVMGALGAFFVVRRK